MAISGVLRAGTIQIKVTELDAALLHYTEVIGLVQTAEGPDGRVYLKAWDEHDHHSVILRESPEAGMDHMGFKVASDDDLKTFEQKLGDAGISTTRIRSGDDVATGERVRFTAPTGHSIELYAEMEQVGNGLSLSNPEVWPDGLKGMQPTRFDHCLLYGDELDATKAIFIDVLGFNLSEIGHAPDGQEILHFLSEYNLLYGSISAIVEVHSPTFPTISFSPQGFVFFTPS